MASGPITSWEIDGETVETVADFIFLGSKIPADGDCSYEIKRCLLLGRKVMTNLDSILKSRDNGNDNPVCKTEKETQIYRTDIWTLWEKARVGCSERIALKLLYYTIKCETDCQTRLDA